MRFGRLIDSARTAIAGTGESSAAFILAGRTIRLVGAGPALLDRLLPAFAHLPAADAAAEADLTVLLWDVASTGVPFPDLGDFEARPGSPVTPTLHGGSWSFVHHAYENAMSYLDREQSLGVYVAADAATLLPWDRACPLRSLLTRWLAPQRLLLAHGAGIGGPGGAVVLAGPGGSGKSTTSMACFAAGMGYLGDDYVLFDIDHQSVWSVYGSAKLAGDHAKRVGWPVRDRPEAIVLSAPVRAIIVPVVTRGPVCTMAPVPASRALMAIAPPTMFQTAGDQRAAFHLTTDFVRGLPTFRLELGAGLEHVPGMIRTLIEEGRAP